MRSKMLILSLYGLAIPLLLFWSKLPCSGQENYHMKQNKARIVDGTKTSNHRNATMKDLKAYVKKIKRAHGMDPSGTYMIIPNIAVPESSGDNETVSLCTQTTANHLHYLKDLTEIWHKPISITVFTHGKEAVFALYAIAYMHKCFKNVLSSVRFHLAYPVLLPPLHLNTIWSMEIHCDNFESLQNDENKLNYDNEIPYPHNVLRNIAIKYALTPYILLIDIDLIPSHNLSEQFTQFITRNSSSGIKDDNDDEKIAYVVPTFESESDHQIPNKQAVIVEWNLKNVRPFHDEICPPCHNVTDYNKWLELPNFSFMGIGFVVEWNDIWEPFYIAKKKNLPLFDGRFKQYGYDRISQICELHIAGYQFAVLNNAFLLHRGFKKQDKFYQQKEAENDQNWLLYNFFKQGLKERYQHSSRLNILLANVSFDENVTIVDS